MTDARFPERWLTDRRLQRLNDGHFRSFITSLTWSVSNRTDGVIEPEDLALIPNLAAGATKAFVDNGLWRPREKGWLIIDFESTQTSRKQLVAIDTIRANDRERKATARAKPKPKTTDSGGVPADVHTDVHTEVRTDVHTEPKGKSVRKTQARTGQARTGQDEAPETLPLAAGDEWHGVGENPFLEYK